MSDAPQTLLVIDDHPLLRKGVSQLVAMEPEMRLVGEAADGSEGLKLARQLEPDLILLDLQMKGMNGLETLKAIKALDTDSRVIMFTVSDSEDDILAALQAGADGYLLKDMEPDEFCRKLRQVAAGSTVLSPEVGGVLAKPQAASRESIDAGWASLTVREQETLELVSKGASNKIIARSLGIAEGTVKVHVKHVLQKLNLRNRFEAAVWLRELREEERGA